MVNAAVAAIKSTGAPRGNTMAMRSLKRPLSVNTVSALFIPIDGCGIAYVAVSCDAIMGMLFKGRLPKLLPAIHTAVTEGGYTVFVQNAWEPYTSQLSSPSRHGPYTTEFVDGTAHVPIMTMPLDWQSLSDGLHMGAVPMRSTLGGGTGGVGDDDGMAEAHAITMPGTLGDCGEMMVIITSYRTGSTASCKILLAAYGSARVEVQSGSFSIKNGVALLLSLVKYR